jgi:2-oxoglutarate dehydrogenase E2 component (dihydrolipoamide succinyltransferase)
MADFELIMPKMGESIMEATIIDWLKNEGDPIEEDEAVLEIATDKVDSEVPSPVSGVLSKILYKKDDVVEVGKPIAIIKTEAEVEDAPVSTPSVPATPIDDTPAPSPVSPVAEEVAVAEPMTRVAMSGNGHATNGTRFYSPLVLNIARTESISIQELEQLPGSGKEGRVTKKDILAFVKNRKAAPATETPVAKEKLAVKQTPAPSTVSYGDNVEIIEMDRMRKLIADHMVKSKHTSPHVTSFVEADVTNMVLWRNRIKQDFLNKEGEKITFTPLFIEAIVRALKDFPFVNSSVDGYTIIRKKDINIGMATALPNGNLIVPVIKNADQLNLVGLTKQVNDLATRARSNKLNPDDISGGTFTITNVGTFGNLMGTPVINQPQVAILATGAIKKKPVVVETPEGDMIAIRHMMFLSMSYDHRIVDGAMGGAFIRKVADIMEAFDPQRSLY